MSDSPLQPARPEDAATLSAIALESKAHWGYDEAFMALCRDELTITAADVARYPTFALREGAAIVGFYMLVPREAGVIELDLLYLLPAAIGRGHGRRLFEHAVRTARAAGYRTMHIQGDPNAAEFYRRMGARPVGSTPSGSVPGRVLPTFHLDLR
jgi:GNAT superfamily N-acetyltransferase